MTTTTATTQIYRVYIKAKPEAVWDAITKPEWTEKYGYGGQADSSYRREEELRCADRGEAVKSD